jgi:hypothetical protein
MRGPLDDDLECAGLVGEGGYSVFVGRGEGMRAPVCKWPFGGGMNWWLLSLLLLLGGIAVAYVR